MENDEYNIVFSSMIGHWAEYFIWLESELGTRFDRVEANGLSSCPIHGGKTGEAFRWYSDFEYVGGGICNSCAKLRGSNGIEVTAGLLHYLKKINDSIARVEAAELVKKFLFEMGYVLKTPLIAKQLSKFFRFTNNNVALAYLRSRGLGISNLPYSIRGTDRIAKLDVDKQLVFTPALAALLLNQDGEPVSFHSILLNERYEKDDSGRFPRVKTTEFINKEASLSGAYVSLDSDPGSDTILFGEGIETVLAASQLNGPCRARAKVGGGGSYSALKVPETIKKAVYAVDRDHTLNDAITEIKEISVRYPYADFYVAIPPDIRIGSSDWLDVLNHAKDPVEAWHSSMVEISIASNVDLSAKPRSREARYVSIDGVQQAFSERYVKYVFNAVSSTNEDLFKVLDKLLEKRSPENWYLNERTGKICAAGFKGAFLPVNGHDVLHWVMKELDFGRTVQTPQGRKLYHDPTPAQQIETWWFSGETKEMARQNFLPVMCATPRPALVHSSGSPKLIYPTGYHAESRILFIEDGFERENFKVAEQWGSQLNKATEKMNSREKAVFHRNEISGLWNKYFNQEILCGLEFASEKDRLLAYSIMMAPMLKQLCPVLTISPFQSLETIERIRKAMAIIWRLGWEQTGEFFSYCEESSVLVQSKPTAMDARVLESEHNSRLLASILYLSALSWVDNGAPEISQPELDLHDWSRTAYSLLWWSGLINAPNPIDYAPSPFEKMIEKWLETRGANTPCIAQDLVDMACDEKLELTPGFIESSPRDKKKIVKSLLDQFIGKKTEVTGRGLVIRKKTVRLPDKNNAPYTVYLLEIIRDH